MWLIFAFSGPLLWAASTHIDKYLVDRYFHDADTAVLLVFTALLGAVSLPFIAAFAPGIFSVSQGEMLVMTGAGVLYMAAMLFYLRAIQSHEASVVAPLFQSTILFTILLAWALLGEALRWRQAAGIALIVAGVLVLSLGRGFVLRAFKLRLVLLMLGCGLALALSSVLFKLFAVHDAFWRTTFWNFVGEAIFGLAILAVPAYRRQLAALFRKNPSAVAAINAANEMVNLGGGLGVRFASLMAPVALVSAVSSTVTLFVFAFGILLTLFFPKLAHEDLSRASLMRKGAAALLVAGGVLLGTLTNG